MLFCDIVRLYMGSSVGVMSSSLSMVTCLCIFRKKVSMGTVYRNVMGLGAFLVVLCVASTCIGI